jgi:hypothetical protein
MEKISKSISQKREILKQIHGAQVIDYKNNQRFYMPDEFVDVYIPILKKAYGATIAHNIALIFMVLARRCDKDGVCYPSYQNIMAGTGISNRNQIRDALQIMNEDLKMFDYLPGKGKNSNMYKLRDIKFWTAASSINPKASSIKKPILQYHSFDTRRNCIKELLLKEQKLLKLPAGPEYKLLK